MSPAHRTRGKRSKFEARVGDALGEGWEYETHKLPYTLNNNYIPDYSIYAARGTALRWVKPLHVEAKGRFTSSDRRKMLAAKEANPLHDIRITFMRNNFLFKGSKTTYTAWADKHGFKNSVFPALPFSPEELKTLCNASSFGTSSPSATTTKRSPRTGAKLRRRPWRRPSSARAAGSASSATKTPSPLKRRA